jgi:hypothetical protein
MTSSGPIHRQPDTVRVAIVKVIMATGDRTITTTIFVSFFNSHHTINTNNGNRNRSRRTKTVAGATRRPTKLDMMITQP